MNKSIAAALLTLIFMLCACDRTTTVASGTPPPTYESDSSKSFFSAVERGDHNAAVSILQETVAKPNPPAAALFNLGLAYEKGEGIKQDSAEAAKWYQKAAEKGYPAAEFNLAVLYANGNGVPSSMTDALKWYRIAASHGYRGAQYNLGVLYAKGIGVPESKELAYMWWDLAATEDGLARGPAERNKQRLASQMTPEAISRAERIIDRCKSSNYTNCE